MGAPVGNTNSSRDNRLWADTIRRAIRQGDGEQLRKIAEKLIALAAEGDLQAIKELGDRLDGKSSQAIAATIDHTGVVTHEHRAVSETASFLAEALGAGADRAPQKPLSH